MLSEIEGMREKTLEFFDKDDSFVLNVKDQSGNTLQSFFDAESLNEFIEGSVCETFEDLDLEIQESLKTILKFCEDNNIQKVWF